MKERVEYDLVTGNSSELAEYIDIMNQMLNAGWEMDDRLIVKIYNGQSYFYQSMVRYHKNEDIS